MKKHLIALLTTLAVTLPAVPATAQAADNDVRCLMLSNLFAKADADPQRKQFAAAASLFFLGRVDARLSQAALKSQILAQAKTIDKATAGPLMTECGKRMQTSERSMLAIGQDIAKTVPQPPKK